MKNTYIVRKMPEGTGAYPFSGAFAPGAVDNAYRDLDELRIGQYAWSDGGYEPEAYARVGWNENGLCVLMYAREETIRADERTIGGRVCEDSCMEFFFKPCPDADARYLNIEVNPIGTAHIGLGEGRPNRTVWPALPEGMLITHSDHDARWWAVSYTIPASFLEELFGKRMLRSGHAMLGNFYKCDESVHPHFGSWNRVTVPRPDFHRPECFGELVLE